jgi:hypothetical protein
VVEEFQSIDREMVLAEYVKPRRTIDERGLPAFAREIRLAAEQPFAVSFYFEVLLSRRTGFGHEIVFAPAQNAEGELAPIKPILWMTFED